MFIKFQSIENHHHDGFITKFILNTPWANTAKFCIQEKIDGANIQILFTPNEEMRVGKRTTFITKDEDFFGIWETLDIYKAELNIIQKEVNKTGRPLRFFGEIFGTEVNVRVLYNKPTDIKFFDIAEEDGKLWRKDSVQELFSLLEIDHLFVDILFTGTLTECLLFYGEKPSMYGPNLDTNICEGVIISPYENSNEFKVKKKNPQFVEKEGGKVVTPSATAGLLLLIQPYLNENRVISLISKQGKPKTGSEMSLYIKLATEDAFEDLLKDYPEYTFTKEDLSKVNTGKYLAHIIRKYLPTNTPAQAS